MVRSAQSSASLSVAPDEIERFSAQAADWWEPEGSFRFLHRLNPVRIGYVRDRIAQHRGRSVEKTDRHPLQGLSLLDIGCGGGLLTEPLARLGADVTGLDASGAAIAEATRHAATQRLSVRYRMGSAEEMAAENQRFDVVTALEIVEHVADLGSFLDATTRLVRPDGLLILSTLNRTPASWLLGIAAAEYVLGWVPRGTHDWKAFVRPSELVAALEARGFETADLTGMVFRPLTGDFALRPHRLDVNYLLTAQRR